MPLVTYSCWLVNVMRPTGRAPRSTPPDRKLVMGKLRCPLLRLLSSVTRFGTDPADEDARCRL